ncbi:metal-sensitive transcriptional regulator [Candidatus Jidaibacter acanthamoebae]|nr:metal-sensitive transcriptional regulator [Candidatus Jidaibacter acanthamoeba]
MTKKDCHKHPSYKDELPRLNRINGQLDGIKKMINEERYCPEILTQLRAVRSAVRNLELLLLEKHILSCVFQAFQSTDTEDQKQKIQEVKEILKRFE